MKPSFVNVKQHHYSSNKYHANFLGAEDLYQRIGYRLNDLKRQNTGYANTCAVRMSLALIEAGVKFAGRLKIKSGPHKGKMIEPGAKLLADQLMKKQVFGHPVLVNPKTAVSDLRAKKGIVLFWKIQGYGGGHIDLIEPVNAASVCNSACYFSSKEIWFWPLQ